MVLSQGKLKHMRALANNRGVIAAAAMDQRGSLQKALAQAKGVDKKEITPEIIGEFKTIIAKVLTPHASAILLDPEYGLEAKDARSPHCGLLLAYELTGYDTTQPGRLPDLLPHVSAKRIAQWGADAVKVLIYYSPFEDAGSNDVKHALVERVGSECDSCGIPFFLEIVTYDATGGDEKGFEYAKAKPAVVIGGMEEFSKPQYQVDVLKVEVPVNSEYMEGSSVYKGQKAYSLQEGAEHYRAAGAVSTVPYIFLSAGVSNAQFVESLRMAAESDAHYSGVLCGRATWKGGISVYAKNGPGALEDWLSDEGVKNIQAVNEAIQLATPWYKKAGVEVAA